MKMNSHKPSAQIGNVLNLLGIQYSFCTCTAQPTLTTFSKQTIPGVRYILLVAGAYLALQDMLVTDGRGIDRAVSEHPSRSEIVSDCFIIGDKSTGGAP
jgi:hypothetical protein